MILDTKLFMHEVPLEIKNSIFLVMLAICKRSMVAEQLDSAVNKASKFTNERLYGLSQVC